MASSSCSIRTGSVWSVSPSRRARRVTWVSTGRPGSPIATLRTTLAVLRPTPGRVTRSSIGSGTDPSKRSTTARAIPIRLRGLGPEEPRRMDHRLDLDRIGTGEGLRRRPSGKHRRRHAVDHLVGRLRRQDRGDEELERAVVVELAELDHGAGILARPGAAPPRRRGPSVSGVAPRARTYCWPAMDVTVLRSPDPVVADARPRPRRGRRRARAAGGAAGGPARGARAGRAGMDGPGGVGAGPRRG